MNYKTKGIIFRQRQSEVGADHPDVLRRRRRTHRAFHCRSRPSGYSYTKYLMIVLKSQIVFAEIILVIFNLELLCVVKGLPLFCQTKLNHFTKIRTYLQVYHIIKLICKINYQMAMFLHAGQHSKMEQCRDCHGCEQGSGRQSLDLDRQPDS